MRVNRRKELTLGEISVTYLFCLQPKTTSIHPCPHVTILSLLSLSLGVLTDTSCLEEYRVSVVHITSMSEHPNSHRLCPVNAYVI